MGYLTKSLFRMALDCETRPWYASKRDVYANKSLDDSFLQSLAEGGFQVGALAQFLLAEDPVASELLAKATTTSAILAETSERMSHEDAAMAEAGFSYAQFFVRADLVRKSGNSFDLYEVKAKSFDGTNDDFWTKGRKGIVSKWRPYLYDVAFQAWVIGKGHPEWNVRPFLVLVDKTKHADIDGLNQCFKINRSNNLQRIVIRPGLTRRDLGTMVVTAVDVSEEVAFLLSQSIESEAFGIVSFEEYVARLSDAFNGGHKLSTPVGKKCRNCPFRADPGSLEAEAGLKSGFHECWKERQGIPPEAFESQSVLDLWDYRKTDDLIARSIYFLSELAEEPDWSLPIVPDPSGLTRDERQMLQVQSAASGASTPFLMKSGLAEEMRKWKYPLHFIDFETSAPALPFTRGHRPYETIAFQFSMHDVQADGRISHAAQFLDSTVGEHPNYNFLRALKVALEKDDGTVFRYANHENTVLSQIRASLLDAPEAPDDVDDMVAFAESLIRFKDEYDKEVIGRRCMVDMLDLVSGDMRN